MLVSAVGELSVLRECEIKGVERYQGKMSHSANWDRELEWMGRRLLLYGKFSLSRNCDV